MDASNLVGHALFSKVKDVQVQFCKASFLHGTSYVPAVYYVPVILSNSL